MNYYLLYLYRWNKHTPRNTHVTYRAIRTTASASKWRTDPNIETSVLIPDRILHIFSEEPELLSILDYQPVHDIDIASSVVLQRWRVNTEKNRRVLPTDKHSTPIGLVASHYQTKLKNRTESKA